MDIDRLALFAAAYLAIVVLPGPAVTALVARVLARGPRGAAAYVAGIAAGALVWFALAAAGLSVLAAAFAGVFVVLRYAGAAWLLYLAWKLWTSAPQPMEQSAVSGTGSGGLFLAGLALNLGNPKAILFFLALLPSVVDLQGLTPLAAAEMAAIIVAVVAGVFGAYAVMAARLRRLLVSPQALRIANRGSSVAVAGAAALVATR
ncbi:LysE family translocator [Reyranella sp.]|uniref:LysE family translocator n=1 Tax=Reyranella sp. TaxID=1929291 RepID=UPI003BAB77CE